MAYVPEHLRVIAGQVGKGEKPAATVRELLEWFGASRRGFWIVRGIEAALEELKLSTIPNFRFEWIDGIVSFVKTPDVPPKNASANLVGEATIDAKADSPLNYAAVGGPMYRIGKLDSANRSPLSVTPESSIEEAVTQMLSNDFSQLPVMTGLRSVKGIVSWESIGMRLAQNRKCVRVADCMETPTIISSDLSIFQAIASIVKSNCVLVIDKTNAVTGLVTTSDLSEQFGRLAEPFLLLGEIEDYIRSLIGGKFSQTDLIGVRDPDDDQRTIKDVADLTFGEYIRLLENPDRWPNLGLSIDRTIFIRQLDVVREIRNDVMHFDPDGIGEPDLEKLRKFRDFLEKIRKIEGSVEKTTDE